MSEKWIAPVSIIFAGVIFFACSYDKSELEKYVKEKYPAEEAVNVTLDYTEFGEPKIKVKAGKMTRYEKPENFTLLTQGVNVLFFDSTGNIQSEINCEIAELYQDKALMIAKHNVIVKDLFENKQLRTEQLIWDQKKEIIHTNSEVEIITADEIIRGEGFEADQQFTKYKIKKINGTIKVTEDES
jgi:LPS export ABC transporter protein LptC